MNDSVCLQNPTKYAFSPPVVRLPNPNPLVLAVTTDSVALASYRYSRVLARPHYPFVPITFRMCFVVLGRFNKETVNQWFDSFMTCDWCVRLCKGTDDLMDGLHSSIDSILHNVWIIDSVLHTKRWKDKHRRPLIFDHCYYPR